MVSLVCLGSAMTEQPPKKPCSACGKDLPATTAFFFPSYLQPGGKNVCKACHKERGKPSRAITYRAQLRERATPISSEQVPLHKSLNSIAAALGLSVQLIEHDIFDRNLPVYTFIYHNTGPALALQTEDAEVYMREHAHNGHQPAAAPEQPDAPPEGGEEFSQMRSPSQGSERTIHEVRADFQPLQVESHKPEAMGSPDACGCCHTDKGNILAVHNTDRQVVAYLCSPCYRAAKSFDWEPERLRAVARLIEIVGGTIDRSRR